MNKEDILKIFPSRRLFYKNDNQPLTKVEVNLEDIVDKILWLNNVETGELKGKIYAYETIISNSNFKSILSKDKQSYEKRINELEKQIQENTNE